MSDSLDDPFIQDLLDEFGPHGYLMWFGLIEIISKESGHNITGDVVISEVYLRRKLRGSTVKLKQFLDYCSASSKLLYNYSGKNINIKMPKILEIKDNHTKNLQVASKLVSLEAEEDADKDAEEEKEREKGKPRSKPKKKKKVLEVSREYVNKMIKEFPTDDVPRALQEFYDYIEIHGKKYKNYDLAFQARMRNDFPNPKKKKSNNRDKYDAI